MAKNNYFPEMYRLYVERLIKFRLAPAKLIQYLNIPYIEGKDFTDEMQYLFKNGKQLKMYNIPIHNTDTGFNEDSYTELIKEIIKISLEDNINYF